MGDSSLSRAQRMFRRLSSPELFAAMERDSRLWKADCPHCRAGTSLWEMGGIRYKAVGEPLTRLRCPKCGQKGWMRIRWTGGDPAALGHRPSAIPLILMVSLVVMVPLLLLIGAVSAILLIVLS